MIGKDSNLSFWYDAWTKNGSLRQQVQGPLPRGVAEWKVKDIASSEGWRWDHIPFDFPSSLKLEIQAIPFALASSSRDKILWKESPRGEFNLKSVYKMASGLNPNSRLQWTMDLEASYSPKNSIFSSEVCSQ